MTKNHNSKDDCLFCKIVQGKEPSHKVFENEQVYAFLDIYPKSEGHTLVIPKNHSVNLLDAPAADICAVMEVVKKLANEYQESLGAAGFKVFINNGRIANQIIPHLHAHLLPIYEDKTKNKSQGEVSQEQLESIAKTITSHR